MIWHGIAGSKSHIEIKKGQQAQKGLDGVWRTHTQAMKMVLTL